MDAQDDVAEIGLQQSSNVTIVELQKSIPALLFSRPTHDGSAPVLRSRVRADALKRLWDLLAPFQELPQLLDPGLEKIVTPLSTALIGSLSSDSARKFTAQVTPSSYAVCSLLCTLCRVRGAKVIVRFLSNEARYLELVVNILESDFQRSGPFADQELRWEERYIFLLWLSHLVLTPFPLSSTSQRVPVDSKHGSQLELLSASPFLTQICDLALSQVSSASKEREAAVLTLVHLVGRPDMVQLSLLQHLLAWIETKIPGSTAPSSDEPNPDKTHESIGALALLAGIFRTADAKTLAPHLKPTVNKLIDASNASSGSASGVFSSAVARKLMVKTLRCAALAAVSLSAAHTGYEDACDEIVEETIEQLLNLLSDPDTPVRHAASKALSMLTIKLETNMSMEVIEAVIASLDENVLWTDTPQHETISGPKSLSRARNLSLVNPLRWQGLILTLAQLLFRKASDPTILPPVVSSLLLGLTFEQRTSIGVSVGGPVRDAANFGLWALARQYTTTDLDGTSISAVQSIAGNATGLSLLQILACELVCSACLDPSGNIRRGSSAALQELIGRHPDTIKDGIGIVQTVDYHAVALRSSALTKVTVQAAGLNAVYRKALLAALFGWRGIGSVDAESRRWASKAVGKLTCTSPELAAEILETLRNNYKKIGQNDVEARHGVILSIACILDETRRTWLPLLGTDSMSELRNQVETAWDICAGLGHVDEKFFTNPTLRSSLTAEAVMYILSNLLGFAAVSPSPVRLPSADAVAHCARYIELSLPIRDETSLKEAASTAEALFASNSMHEKNKQELAQKWYQLAQHSLRSGHNERPAALGWLAIFSRILVFQQRDLASSLTELIVDTTTGRVTVEVRVAAIESLEYVCQNSPGVIQDSAFIEPVFQALIGSLNNFTTDQRGDVGSLVRAAALRCINCLPAAWLDQNRRIASTLNGLVCGLAVEKLDRVRAAARPCLKVFNKANMQSAEGDSSSVTYFLEVMTIALDGTASLLVPMIMGLVTAVGGGSETVLRSSREALQILLTRRGIETKVLLLEGLSQALARNTADERLTPNVLTTIAFLFETGALNSHRQSQETAPIIRNLFAIVQKAHYKSTNIVRLLAAVDIYASLAEFSCVHTSILKKLCSLLSHPFPLVRRKAAEALYSVTDATPELDVNWAKPASELKNSVQAVREAVLVK